MREKREIQAQELDIRPFILSELLAHRGIAESEIPEFLNPSYATGVHDPYLLKDMDKAVDRILKAVAENQKIVIFSDYDADGVPGGVVMHDFLKKIGYTNFINYIPHRHDEGFGLNLPAIEQFAKDGARLLITIDCGIADVEKVAHANSLGLEVIITDHHIPGPTLPPAFAIINPKQSDCQYPEKMLCGSGVIYKVIQGVLAKNRFDIKEGWEKWLLDMVGLATLSDMVPLRGENRVFAFYGLKVLRKSPRAGLLKLLKALKVQQQHIVEDDVGFLITPRINAASRMGIPMDAFRMLSTQDEVEADLVVKHLNKINDERKGTVASIVKELKKSIEKHPELVERSVIVMGNPEWKPALLGLAANTLMREYQKPVFLWGREGGEFIKGSCRSDGSASVVTIMHGAPAGTFVDFGGHHMSGGFSASHENIHLLFDRLCETCDRVKTEGSATLPTFIDMKLTLDEVTWNTYRVIESLAPFGEGNPKPLFLFENVEVTATKLFGKEKNHLELMFENTFGKKIPTIAFFAIDNPNLMKVKAGDRINLLAHLEKSVFRNFPELRMRIVDVV
jgi:single-stranded-DNA-specific exonuclease